MAIIDGIMLGAFVLFVIFLIRGVALQTQEKERKRAMKNPKKESEK